ncbi:hypothetical protein [Methylobacter tundripaludum]|jgi:hypothetical protein|uniref:hypothetical protein n=1 Tax=Methylobacter tundripaludum TaxID=173365 RepID=UPI000ADA60ED|nr:hypothetical protein [Methylobacter tundripaludum]MDP3332272.1 hypothetical protein [Methylococcaceae bacterium]
MIAGKPYAAATPHAMAQQDIDARKIEFKAQNRPIVGILYSRFLNRAILVYKLWGLK